MAGRLVHFELPVENTARATQFYESLFGWTFSSWDGPVEYHMTEAGGDPGGAVYARQSGEHGPIVYFDTEDIDAHIGRVRELGGSADERSPIAGVGWYARCTDTEGNSFSLFQSDESVEPG